MKGTKKPRMFVFIYVCGVCVCVSICVYYIYEYVVIVLSVWHSWQVCLSCRCILGCIRDESLTFLT